MLKTSPRRAYTLTELLVVLAIIMILSALLLGVFSSVRESGGQTVCLSNEKQIYKAFQLYVADNDGLHPKQSEVFLIEGDDTWVDAIAPLVASAEVFHCPSDSEWPDRVKNQTSGIYSTMRQKQWASSYIVNGRALSNVDFFGKVTSFSGLAAKPSSTVLLADGAKQAFGKAPYVVPYIGNAIQQQSFSGNLLGDPKGLLKQIGGCCNGTCDCLNLLAPDARHKERSNVLFFDGHVKSMQNSQWYFPDTPYLDPARGG